MSTLLLVADDVWVKNDVAAALTEPNTTLETVDDPEEAAAILADRHYDAVIVDMQVKSMGGMALTRMLHDSMALGRAERTPVIMLLDRRADVFLAKRASSDAYLVKPFTSQDLRSTLSAFQPTGA